MNIIQLGLYLSLHTNTVWNIIFRIYFLMEEEIDKGSMALGPRSHGSSVLLFCSCPDSEHPIKDLRSLSFSGSDQKEPCSVTSPRVGASLNFVP